MAQFSAIIAANNQRIDLSSETVRIPRDNIDSAIGDANVIAIAVTCDGPRKTKGCVMSRPGMFCEGRVTSKYGRPSTQI